MDQSAVSALLVLSASAERTDVRYGSLDELKSDGLSLVSALDTKKDVRGRDTLL